jgi:hypothetical protein
LALREANVGPAPPDMHTVEPTYSGKDIALGLTVQISIGEKRGIAVQTHVTRDCAEHELNAVLDKVTKALDRQNAKYRQHEIQARVDMQKKKLAEMMENHAKMFEKWQKDWDTGKRRGPFEMTASQQANKVAMDNTFNQNKYELELLEIELGELEQQCR